MITEPIILEDKFVVRGPTNEWRALSATIRWIVEADQRVHFVLNDRHGSRRQTVKLVWTDHQRGRRARFVCPKSGLACNQLILVDGELASIKGHGLDYRSQVVRDARAAKATNKLLGANGYRCARGAQRQSLLEKARLRVNDDASASPVPGFCPGESTPKRRTTPDLRYPMASGLRILGEDSGADACSGLRDAQLSESVHRWEAAGVRLPPLSAGLQCLDDLFQLDFETSLRSGLIVEGQVRRFMLSWATSPNRAFLGAFDLRDPERAVLHLRGHASDFQQTIQIATRNPRPRSRRAFLCPVTGRRTEQLYWRANRFASREAQRLVYRSRRFRRKAYPSPVLNEFHSS